MGSFFMHTILKFVHLITCSEKLKSSILCYNKLKIYLTYFLLEILKRITAINVNPFLTKIDFHVARNMKILTFSWFWHLFSWLFLTFIKTFVCPDFGTPQSWLFLTIPDRMNPAQNFRRPKIFPESPLKLNFFTGFDPLWNKNSTILLFSFL